MMSLSTIHEMSRKQAIRSAKMKVVPFMIETEDLNSLEEVLRGIPFIGDRVPRGYKLVEKIFVDSSGFGSEAEPAMTFPAFVRKVYENGPGHAYAVMEAGEFQVYVGHFVKRT